MTPKEKAKEIFEKFYNIKGGHNCMFWDDAIICSLIAVDEIISILDYDYTIPNEYGNPYWVEVKQEIEKL